MNKSTSLQLDLMRFLAAFAVFLAHFSFLGYTGTNAGFFQEYGHDAVIVFFVLSGYVITWSAVERHSGFSDYLVARLSRLWSVLVVGVFATVALDVIGRSLQPEIYAGLPQSFPVVRIVATLLFLNETWIHIKPFSNGPLWSISYEFWYYILFGSAFFLSGWRKWAGLALAIAVTGPIIMLLFPIWALGAAAYWIVARYGGLPAPGLILPASLLALILTVYFEPLVGVDKSVADFLTGGNQASLVWSQNFVSDYTKGLFVFFMVLSFPRINFPPARSIARLIKFLASFSFTLYVFHVPLIFFARSLAVYDPSNVYQSVVAGFLIFASTWAISLFTEQKKVFWRSVAEKLVHLISRNRIMSNNT